MNRLKDMREDNDKTQDEIAKVLNISRQYYSRYELGEVDLPIRHYITLAKFYNTSIDYLAGIIPEHKALSTDIKITAKQQKLINAYEKNKIHQKTIDKILDI